jgi:curved DNA-binding protein CbpA
MRERDPDPYSVLHTGRMASRAEVARAYRSMAKRHHPDLPGGGAEAMAKVNWAWHVLSDPARRAAWDAAHGGPAMGHWAPEARGQRVRPAAPGEPSNATWTGWAEYRAEAMRDEQAMAGLSLGCIALVIVVALLMVFVLLAGLASTQPRNPDAVQSEAVTTAAP